MNGYIAEFIEAQGRDGAVGAPFDEPMPGADSNANWHSQQG